MSEEWTNRGGKRVQLFVPVKIGDVEINEVTLKMVTFGHQLRWNKKEIAGPFALLMELSGRSEEELAAIGYPDIERVLSAFLSMLPEAMRASIAGGDVMPVPAKEQPVVEDKAFDEGLIRG